MDQHLEQKFRMLQMEGKKLAAEGKLKESLNKFLLAKEICSTTKIITRIEKLKHYIKECGLGRLEIHSKAEVDDSENYSEKMLPISPNSMSDGKSEQIHPIQNIKPVMMKSGVLNNVKNLEESKQSINELNPQSEIQFQEFKKKAKELSYKGLYDEAIKWFKMALKIYKCPRVMRYIEEIEKVMKNNEKENVVPEKTEDFLIQSKIHKNEFVHKNAQSSESVAADEKMLLVKNLYYEARQLAVEGELKKSLELLKKAQLVCETEKVEKHIKKIEELLATTDSEEVNDEMVNVTSDFSIYCEIYNHLYSYQREGVAWMWNLYKMKKGGILGDDMGLGKTFQVIAFLSGMIDADLLKHVLIIMPVSLLANWEKEFKKWCPGISVHNFHGGSKKERERNLLRVYRRGHVLLTSYGMLVGNLYQLTHADDREFVWDYVILDEGHKIKNPTKTTKAVHDIPSKNRLILTGTPVQNNLRELWSLYDFVQQGSLLGSLKTFKLQYENPITRAREKDATAGEKRLGTEMAENLKSMIKPYFLRRTKEEIWLEKENISETEEIENGLEKLVISEPIAKKNDIILWTFMSVAQIEIYQSFLHSDAVKSILISKRSPLVELTTLKKICDHPRLLSKRACLQLGLDGDLKEEELNEMLDSESSTVSSIEDVSDETLLHESGKLKLVIDLIHNLHENGHRTLIFSLSRKILDMIHRILINRQWKVMRLDGTITKTEERERRIQKFQNDPSYPVFLLTTQVGGVGITLTAADRVIIYDPSWNPAVDAQAVDRAYRIGQQKNVIVYRLITCGSVEEKIYRRQIFKDSITQQTTGSAPDPHRYFSKQELRELFVLDNPHYSVTQVQLAGMHSAECNTYAELKNHIEYLTTLNIFGISHHDLMFTQKVQDPSEDNDQTAVSIDYIKKQVALAHELIQKESTVVEEGMRLAGAYNRPYQESIPLSKKIIVKDAYKPPHLPDINDLTEVDENVPDRKEQACSIDFNIDQLDSPSFQNKTLTGIHHDVEPQDIKLIYSSTISSVVPINHLQDIKRNESEVYISSNLIQGEKSNNKFNDVGIPTTLTNISENMHTMYSKNSKEHSYIDDVLHKDGDAPLMIDNEMVEKETLCTDDSASKELKISFESLKVDPDLQTKFQNNLTQLMTDDFDLESLTDKFNVDFIIQGTGISDWKYFPFHVENKPKNNQLYNSVAPVKQICRKITLSIPNSLRSHRKSCARKSTTFLSDGENSQEDSCLPNLNNTVCLVEESDNPDSSNSFNSAFSSVVPDSMPNTPKINKPTQETRYVTPNDLEASPQKSYCSEIQLKNTPENLLKQQMNGSAKRITPLKINRSIIYQDAPFVKALAASPILSPPDFLMETVTVPEEADKKAQLNSPLDESNVDDSPIKMKRKKVDLLKSDSDNSDGELDNVAESRMHTSVLTEEEFSKSVLSVHSNSLFSEDESVEGNETNNSIISDSKNDEAYDLGSDTYESFESDLD